MPIARQQPSAVSSSLVRHVQDDVEATAETHTYFRLQILEERPGESPDEAFVKFQFWYREFDQKGKDLKSRTELSRFVRTDGEWLYREAVEQAVVA